MPLLVMKKRIKNIGRIELKEKSMMMVLNNLSTKILLRIVLSLILRP
jgi:hypothetical protein